MQSQDNSKLTLRATQIESLMQCPMIYKFRTADKDFLSRLYPDALTIGNIFHLSRQSPALAHMLREKSLLKMERDLEAKHMCLAPKWKMENEFIEKVYEYGMSYETDDIKLTGTPDIMGITNECFTIADYKSTKIVWDENKTFELYHQWYIYSALAAYTFGLKDDDDIRFSYLVEKKKKAGTHEQQTISIKKSVGFMKEKFATAINTAILAVSLDDFNATPDTTDRCFTCGHSEVCRSATASFIPSKNGTKTGK